MGRALAVIIWIITALSVLMFFKKCGSPLPSLNTGLRSIANS
jgi:hypothetical protein